MRNYENYTYEIGNTEVGLEVHIHDPKTGENLKTVNIPERDFLRMVEAYDFSWNEMLVAVNGILKEKAEFEEKYGEV